MKTLHTRLSTQPALIIQKLYRLERSGKYEEALTEIREIWEDLSTFPNITELDGRTAAEMLLRCGALVGFFGHIKQIPDSQQCSKNLLTEARQRFLHIYDVEKIAECENYLALAYSRTGERLEAETWIEEALFHNLPNSSQTRLYSYIIKSLILHGGGRHSEILEILEKLENDFQTYGDDSSKGDYYNSVGLALKNAGNLPGALKYLELARNFHQKSQHKIYLGTVENNLALFYKEQSQFAKAYEAVDSATKIFKQIKDRTREGFSLDTKAQIYFAERKYAESLKTVEAAITILKKSENLAYLTETYLTKAKTLIHLDDFPAATLCLFDAVQIARVQIGEESALDLIREFELVLQTKNSLPSPSHEEKIFNEEIGGEDLKLVLPPELAHYQEFQGVWINNTYLEKVGLPKGALAIVIKEKVGRGDLVAIAEIGSDSVVCGFYDSDFGVVCLEGDDCEPQLFDEKDVEILGRIVGVCNTGRNADGSMIVEAINI